MHGQLHAPAALQPEEKPPVPMDRGLGGSQNWSGRGGEEKSLAPIGSRSTAPGSFSPSPAAIPTELCRLLVGITVGCQYYYRCKIKQSVLPDKVTSLIC
jgi:hypothetical protein